MITEKEIYGMSQEEYEKYVEKERARINSYIEAYYQIQPLKNARSSDDD